MSVAAPPAARHFSYRRVWSVVLRQAYLYKRTLHRWLELVYWPLVDLLLWGFISVYLQKNPGSVPKPAAFFVGALLLWEVLFRAQQALTVGFLEDVWSHNLLNVWAGPIRTSEYLTGLIVMSVIRVLTGASLAIGLAAAIFGFNLFTFGIALLPFVVLLVAMGWAIGIATTALLLRFGESADVLAWALVFVFQPFSAVFYPVSVLPVWVRGIAHAIPSSHIFEGMRSVIAGRGFPGTELAWAAALDVVYLAAGWTFFTLVLRSVRRRGLLSRFGE